MPSFAKPQDQERARLLALATAVPPYRLDQQDVMAASRRIFAGRSEVERLLPVFANAGIATRYSCVPLEWYLKPSGWKARNDLYVENALALLAQAAERCLARAGIGAEAVDLVITVSTSGIATPSLDARLLNRLPLPASVERLPVFGLGCAGGVLGLARAARLAQARPEANVLLLVVELCGLTFRNPDCSNANIVASALFGDGAAAALVSCRADGSGPVIRGWGEHTWPDTLEVMGWRVEDDGFGVLFSQDIPAILRRRYGAALDGFLAAQGLGRGDLAGTICHPGGAKVMAALEAVFGLETGAMATARQVLRDYGNMSAASVLFVLEAALAKPGAGLYLMSALGPGFTAAFALLERP